MACNLLETNLPVSNLTTDLYIRIDRKLDPARLPSLLDPFQQPLPPLYICAHTSDSQEETVSGVRLLVAGHNNGWGVA